MVLYGFPHFMCRKLQLLKCFEIVTTKYHDLTWYSKLLGITLFKDTVLINEEICFDNRKVNINCFIPNFKNGLRSWGFEWYFTVLLWATPHCGHVTLFLHNHFIISLGNTKNNPILSKTYYMYPIQNENVWYTWKPFVVYNENIQYV